MVEGFRPIDSPETMSAAIRRAGIIPFVRNTVPGWSVEEMTAPGCWFMDDDAQGVLGPWDWKIEVIAEGDIAYGKFIRNKAAFATAQWYAHLMNWRRSQQRYRMPLGEEYPGANVMDQFYRTLSPTLLSAIRELGSINGSDIRTLLTERTTVQQRSQVRGCMGKYLLPQVKRAAADSLNQYLEMGTWTIVGNFKRVYRGPDLEYKGWQKSSITTPEALFMDSTGSPGPVQAASSGTEATGSSAGNAQAPFWARFIEPGICGYGTGSDDIPGDSDGTGADEDRKDAPAGICSMPDCSPEESRDLIIAKILENFPHADRKQLLKLI